MPASRKLYDYLAKALKDEKPIKPIKPIKPTKPNSVDYESALATWQNVVKRVCTELADDNPRFSATLFKDACGYND